MYLSFHQYKHHKSGQIAHTGPLNVAYQEANYLELTHKPQDGIKYLSKNI